MRSYTSRIGNRIRAPGQNNLYADDWGYGMISKLAATFGPLAFGLLYLSNASAAQSDEERSLNELRNTVVNLLQGLVDRGVLTREQAQAMVANAEQKAAAEATAAAEKDKQEEKKDESAVRVPYVPQIVKDEITKEVVTDLQPTVKDAVVAQVGSTGVLFSALPEWVQRMKWTGDVRVREEGIDFGKDNIPDSYLDFNEVNSAGGIGKAGTSAILNTTEDRNRLRLRMRFGFDTDLGSGWNMGMRLATGAGEIFPTTNQTEGTYGEKYQIALDQGFLSWTGTSATDRQIIHVVGGRFANPYVSTDLVWYSDLTFEGISSDYRLNLSSDNTNRHDVFMTLGGFPLSSFSAQNSNPTDENKWLLGGQAGFDLHFSDYSRFQLAAAYYDYIHIVGQSNATNSTLLNWSAPAFVQKGNTLFDISNSTDPTVNLFALASDFKIVDLLAIGNFGVFSHYSVGFVGEAVKNVGFNSVEVAARTGTYVAPRTNGYRVDALFGSSVMGELGTWQASLGYRYLQRDAVLDAFNDEDFHLGGTDARGYTLRFDYSLNPKVFVRVKYMSSDAIDGPTLAIDTWEVDLNAHF